MRLALGRMLEMAQEALALGAVPLVLIGLYWYFSATSQAPAWATPHDSRACPVCQTAQAQARETGHLVAYRPH